MKTADPATPPSDVESVFTGYPADIRDGLLRLRELILNTAQTTEGVGPLSETLKWGQPSYLTTASKSGTTIRIDRAGSSPRKYAMYVHCQTSLVSTFRELYPDALTCEGDRAVIFDVDEAFPEEIVRHCIGLALTYHSRKKDHK